jgi:hypothetical protein
MLLKFNTIPMIGAAADDLNQKHFISFRSRKEERTDDLLP